MRDEGIRKAAVFLNGLDKETAGMLLQRLPAEESRAIRREMIAVQDISPSEINKTVKQFLKASGFRLQTSDEKKKCGVWSVECGVEGENNSKHQTPYKTVRYSGQTTFSGDGDLFELSGAEEIAERRLQSAEYQAKHSELYSLNSELDSELCSSHPSPLAPHPSQEPPAEPRRFDYLERRSAFETAEFLAEEGEPLIAVVLSQMTPRYSGDVLACFEQSLKRNLIRRLARLDATDETILDEIDAVLKDRLKREIEDRPKTKPGLALLEQILQVVENELGDDILSGLNEIEQEECGGDQVWGVECGVWSDSHSTPNSQLQTPNFDDLGLLEDHELEALFCSLDRDLVVKSLVRSDAWFVDRVLGLFPVYEQISLREMLYHATPMDVAEQNYARACVMSGIDIWDEGRGKREESLITHPSPLTPHPSPQSYSW